MVRNLLLMSVVFSSFSIAAPEPVTPEKLERQFISLIVNGHKFPLDPQMHPGCTKNSRTVGELYSQMMNEHIFGGGKEKQIVIHCAPYDAATSPFKTPKKNTAPIECSLQTEWKTDSGNEKLSFSARITRNGSSLERKYLACQIGK